MATGANWEGPEGGPVEADEAFIGGKPANRHKDKLSAIPKYIKNAGGYSVRNPLYKSLAGRGSDKVPVFGLLDREARKVRAKVIPNVDRKTLQNEILENVERGSKVFTDRQPGYKSLPEMDIVHEAINHLNEYVRGEVHTNGLENFWSLLKRGLNGTYVAVEPFHLDRYVDEQVFRYNNRATKDNPLDDADRFILAVSQIAGKRLTYAELTGKTGEISQS
jgi:hypothetical protein